MKKVTNFFKRIKLMLFSLVALFAIGIPVATSVNQQANNTATVSIQKVNRLTFFEKAQIINDSAINFFNIIDSLENSNIISRSEANQISNSFSDVANQFATENIVNNNLSDQEFEDAFNEFQFDAINQIIDDVGEATIDNLLEALSYTGLADELIRLYDGTFESIVDYVSSLTVDEINDLIADVQDVLELIDQINVSTLLNVANQLSATTVYGLSALVGIMYLSSLLSFGITYASIRNKRLIIGNLKINVIQKQKWIWFPLVIGLLAAAAATTLLFLLI